MNMISAVEITVLEARGLPVVDAKTQVRWGPQQQSTAARSQLRARGAVHGRVRGRLVRPRGGAADGGRVPVPRALVDRPEHGHHQRCAGRAAVPGARRVPRHGQGQVHTGARLVAVGRARTAGRQRARGL